MIVNEVYNLFCVDCGEITRQIYKGVYQDGSHLYICKECGCENTEGNIGGSIVKGLVDGYICRENESINVPIKQDDGSTVVYKF